MTDPDRPDPAFDAMALRLLRRAAARRAAGELNTAAGAGLESILAQISDEVTAEAALRVSSTDAPATGGADRRK